MKSKTAYRYKIGEYHYIFANDNDKLIKEYGISEESLPILTDIVYYQDTDEPVKQEIVNKISLGEVLRIERKGIAIHGKIKKIFQLME